jgi:hypothetical protein
MGFFFWLKSGDGTEAPRWLQRWVLPGRPARDDPELDRVKQAAAADVDAMEEEDRRYFRPDGPGHIEDDL